MIPSSSSNLSAKKQGPRPSSSQSRPASRNLTRPSTSASTSRPSSSLSTRPASSLSTRPASRFSQRSQALHARSKLIPLCQTLVTQVTGLEHDPDDEDASDAFRGQVEYCVKHLESLTINKAAASVDMSVIDRQVHGHAMKARINSRNDLSEALQTSYKILKAHINERENDLDQEIKARPPASPTICSFWSVVYLTVDAAKDYLERIKNPPDAPKPLTWADILAEEPFEGEHWEGVYGLPPGSVKGQNRDEDRDEWDSTPSLSPLNSDDLALDDDADESLSSADYGPHLHSVDDSERALSPDVEDGQPKARDSFEDRQQFEELRAKQYWRDDWHTDTPVSSQLDIGNPSSLGPSLSRVFARASGFQDAQRMVTEERYIDEDDVVREVLMALQGLKNIILAWTNNAYAITKDPPRLIHLSLASQESIISSLGMTATSVEHLRRFSKAVFTRSLSSKPTGDRHFNSTRTCEAFADAVDEVVRGFNGWCASREEAMCRAYAGLDEEPLIVSLLSLEHSIRDAYEGTFDALLSVVREVFQIAPGDDPSLFDHTAQRRQPAALTALLLDTLFTSVQRHTERRDHITSDALMFVFVRTAEPAWNMLGNWLKNGMGLGLNVSTGGKSGMVDDLDEEFFIESNGVGIGIMGMGLLDPEFWSEAYSLRSSTAEGDEAATRDQTVDYGLGRKSTPRFLEHVAELVLSTGKAVGLLRALGEPSIAMTFNNWKSFASLVGAEGKGTDGTKNSTTGLFSVSVDTLSQLIHDGLLPQCQAVGTRLVKILVHDCGVWDHLEAIQDLFFMRKGDAMSHFVDVLFIKMDSNQLWGDFHFLNTAFRDVIEANSSPGTKEWVNASLVRLSYRGNKDQDRSIRTTVKSIDGLVMEYSVPFPLAYIFQPKTIQGYNEVFLYLLQIRRAKSVLERILVRSTVEKTLQNDLKVFYAMRSRLSWFVNMLLNFLTTYVIHAQVARFSEIFHKSSSLDEMIQLHDEHLDEILGRCLLKPNASALHRVIVSILDMCLLFSEGFMTMAGDTTTILDVSRHSISMKHRSRRLKRQQKNVIGFSQVIQEDDSSDEDEDIVGDDAEREPPELSFSVSGVDEEDFPTRVERMASELDGLVRFLRRGVESLAGGSTEAAAAFGVFAFALEDWDM
ncbi:hypothetical protein D9619_000707 [Psilocybe cf. subviscida]|uniref:Spindle pole body component n=1 Tax=Psilocybe cf. subviscida TaxID=2480587 RepID=A0A8H5BGI3_9AGAR|nr:hypothetical protein D9619_000707 [Psilocybe cf. subviscida]